MFFKKCIAFLLNINSTNKKIHPYINYIVICYCAIIQCIMKYMFYNIKILHLYFCIFLYLVLTKGQYQLCKRKIAMANAPIKKLKFAQILAIALALSATQAKASYPVIRNYPRATYGAGTQNWAIGQDHLGQMYFGNNSGLLRYDSNSWTIAQNSNYTTIRSVYVDEATGRIYAGGSDDFGYFTTDSVAGHPSGLRYVSLLSTLAKPVRFNEIWNIYKAHSVVWFQGDFNIFIYDGTCTEALTVDDKIATSQLINNILTFATIDGKVYTVIGDHIKLMQGCEPLQGMRICAILPYQDNKTLFVTTSGGLFVHNGARVEPYESDINQFLKQNHAFCATTNGKHLVVGTVNCGAVIKDLNDNSTSYANVETGLLNNTVLSAAFDNQGNVWLGLDNGISYVMCNSAVNNLLGTTSLYGAGYASLLMGNKLYLGTNQGLYVTHFPLTNSATPQSLRPVLYGQVWSIDTIGGDIFVCNDGGLFLERNGTFRRIDGIPGAWKVKRIKSLPEHALVAAYKQFHLIERQGGTWVKQCSVEGYDDPSGNFFEDGRDYIWVSHWRRGVYRLRFSRNFRSFDEIVLFNAQNGLPADQNVSIQMINGSLAFSGEAGHLRYNYDTGTMERDYSLNNICTPLASRLYQSPERDIWCVSPNFIRACFINSSGNYDIDSVSFMAMREKLIPGFVDITFTNSRRMIVSNQDGFYELNPFFKEHNQWEGQIFISRVSANQDSVIYTADSKGDIELPFGLNSLHFEFVLPEYRMPGSVAYSHYLEGYDTQWSSPSSASSKEYTHIHEGRYTLHVRALNGYNGETSECSLSFTILPPWYRSRTAITIYVLLLIALAVALALLIRRSYKRMAKRLEMRKEAEIQQMKHRNEEESLRNEAEIAKLKSDQLEADFKHKSEELSNTTMNVIRKNEILMDIAERISKIKERNRDNDPRLASINKQLSTVQKLIHENISHDDDWRNFTVNFDIVYGNYLRRLNEQHPGLTTSEQRLCSYLKMGLSSKEIAPLLNISFRSVEMARYRLRKKLGLESGNGLTEYLQNL